MSSPAVVAVETRPGALFGAVQCRDLDHATAVQLQNELAAGLEAAPGSALVLDLSQVEYMPSLALSILVKIHKELTQAGRKCVLVGVGPNIKDVMSVTGLTKFLVLRGTWEEAVQFLS